VCGGGGVKVGRIADCRYDAGVAETFNKSRYLDEFYEPFSLHRGNDCSAAVESVACGGCAGEVVKEWQRRPPATAREDIARSSRGGNVCSARWPLSCASLTPKRWVVEGVSGEDDTFGAEMSTKYKKSTVHGRISDCHISAALPSR